MKLVFLTVSLIAAFTVDCRSQPEPASLHSDIAEQPQWPDSEVGDSEDTTSMPTLPHDLGIDVSEDEDPEERSLDTDIPTPLMPDFTIGDNEFDAEEDEEQGENEPRESKCKAKPFCNIAGGKCISSSDICYGRQDPALCKGSCICCIPECPYKDGFFSPTGSRQCFKFYRTSTTWTNAAATCKKYNKALQLAHPYDAISLRSYMRQRWDSGYGYWLDARGTGSIFRWQDNGQYIANDSPLWYRYPPPSKSSSYCVMLLTQGAGRARPSNGTYFSLACTRGLWPLCELPLDKLN